MRPYSHTNHQHSGKQIPQQLVRRWTSGAAGLSVSLQEAIQQVQQPKEAAQVGRRGLQSDSEPDGSTALQFIGTP